MTMNAVETKVVDNGVNVEALLGAREALTESPEAAQFRWRATNNWIRGTHSRSTCEGFFGLGLGGVLSRSSSCSASRSRAGSTVPGS